jgi:hypothetical protein
MRYFIHFAMIKIIIIFNITISFFDFMKIIIKYNLTKY